MNISKRKILMFRCYYDPMIGGKSKQAFSMVELPNWNMELCAAGVFVQCPVKVGTKEVLQDHLVPFGNVQSIKFAPEDEDGPADKQKAA